MVHETVTPIPDSIALDTGQRVPRWVPLAALAVYIIHAVAWPFSLGRDGGAFLQHYFDLFEAQPLLPTVATYRTPLPSLWYGLLLEYPGARAAEVIQAAGFVVAAVCAYRVGLPWGRHLAGVLAAVVLAHPWYGALYHRVDSDGLFAFALIGWAGYAISSARSHRVRTWIAHGLWIVALVMVRPAAQIFALFAVLPILLPDRPLPVRLRQAIGCAATVIALLLAYAAVNHARYGFFGISRITHATQPFMRVLVKDRLVQRNNGPASAELAAAIERHLLPFDPYRGLHTTADALLRSESVRLYSDIVAMSDRIWGWESNYRKLRDVSIESIRANPAVFVLGTASTFLHSLIVKHTVATPQKRDNRSPGARGSHVPADSDIVPYPYQDMWSGTPDHRYDPGSPLGESARQRLAEQDARVATLGQQLPVRNGIGSVSRFLNTFALLYTPMILAVAAGLLALPFMFVTGDPHERVLAALFLLSLVLLAATFAGQVPAIIQYRLPLDPVFLAAGIVGATSIRRGRLQLLAASRAGDERVG